MLTDSNVGLPLGDKSSDTPVADLNALQEVPFPKDGEIRQILNFVIGTTPKIVLYAFNTIATQGLTANDGTSGRWNLVGTEVISTPIRIRFGSYIVAGTVIDVTSLPIDSILETPADVVDVDVLKGTKFQLNWQDVALTAINSTSFTLDTNVQLGSILIIKE